MKRRSLLFGLLLLLLLTGCQEITGTPEEFHWVLVEEGAYTLSDGTRVDRWEEEFRFWRLYKLPDGTELLREDVLQEWAVPDPTESD